MNPPNPPETLPVNPSLLGPLGHEPTTFSEPVALFPGAETYLSKREIAHRRDLLEAVQPRLKLILRPGESILHLFPAAHVPATLDVLGLGWLWRRYFTAAVVLTDQRLIEVLLDTNGKRPATRTLSYPYAEGKTFTTGPRGLVFRPAVGRRQRWSVPRRGDRKLLKRLVPRIAERLLSTSTAGRSVPSWHCPACGAESERRPMSCAGCGTGFRDPRLAVLLALAVPGGGLFYARRFGPGTLDLLGELVLYGMVVIMLLARAGPSETVAAAGAGAIFLALTKLESVHLARFLTARTLPEAPGEHSRVKKWAMAGVAASLVAIALPLALAGTLRNQVDHDLQPTAALSGWSGGFESARWRHGEDAGQRSEWIREDGHTVFVYAFPLGPFESFADVRRELGPAPFNLHGFEGTRKTESLRDPEGNAVTQCRYFVFDYAGNDLHMVLVATPSEWSAEAEAALRQFLEAASWVPARRS